MSNTLLKLSTLQRSEIKHAAGHLNTVYSWEYEIIEDMLNTIPTAPDHLLAVSTAGLYKYVYISSIQPYNITKLIAKIVHKSYNTNLEILSSFYKIIFNSTNYAAQSDHFAAGHFSI